MRVFVAGGTGAIGKLLVPMLIAEGHEVTATTRRPERAEWLRQAGAAATVLDATDVSALAAAVSAAEPEAVIHQLTDLSGGFDQESLERNSRLRQVATPVLVEAAERVGATRLVAQSGAWLYGPGPLPHAEDDPLRNPRESPDDAVLPGILALESAVLGASLHGVVLRYGLLYGPGTGSDDPYREPSLHVRDAATAAVLAMTRGQSRVFNVVDDGEGVSNQRARDELSWEPTRR